ncbi:MAG: helix-turn-helix transcriptional regulator [Candidatus Odinarchaeia archaeon]
MEGIFLILNLVVFSVLASVLTIQVYRLRKVNLEYRKSKNILSDIILSFNNQLKADEAKIEEISKLIDSSVKDESPFEAKLPELEKMISNLENEMKEYVKFQEHVNQELTLIKEGLSSLEEKEKTLEKKIQDMEKKRGREVFEKPIESAIPIERESVLSPLNETELNVLKFLAEEGEKTALEIRDRFKLSREHSSRLLKKLYESGYLERKTSGKPYLYGIKKEMRDILNIT